MNDIEVIELGEDGSFDIPYIRPVSTAARTHTDSYTVEDCLGTESNIVDESFLKNSINVGEYKIYQKTNVLYVILRLAQEEQLKTLTLENHTLQITTDSAKGYKIEIPESCLVKPSSAVCKVWNDFATISFDL